MTEELNLSVETPAGFIIEFFECPYWDKNRVFHLEVSHENNDGGELVRLKTIQKVRQHLKRYRDSKKYHLSSDMSSFLLKGIVLYEEFVPKKTHTKDSCSKYCCL